MPISCLPISLFDELSNNKMSIGQWAAYARILGLDGLDVSMLFLKDHTPVYLAGIEEQLRAAGMRIVMATTYPDFTHPDEVQRMRELDYLVRDIAVCSQLKIRYLRVLAGQAHPETQRKEGIEFAISGLMQAATAAKRYGVELVFEDHYKPGAWTYVDFSHPTDIFLEIADRLRGSGIGINFDTGNITAYGDDPMDVLPKVFDMVKTIHVSDMSARGAFSPVVIGQGVTPNREIFSYLKSHGFDGWLCIEEASGKGLEGIRQSVEYTQKTWKCV